MKVQLKNQELKCSVFLERNKAEDGFSASLIINDKEIELYTFLFHNTFEADILNLSSKEFEDLKKTIELYSKLLNAIKVFYSWDTGCQGFSFTKENLEKVYECYSGDMISILHQVKLIPDFLNLEETEVVNIFLNNIKEKA